MTGLGKVTVTCAAYWDETDAYEGQVFLTVTSYIKSRPALHLWRRAAAP